MSRRTKNKRGGDLPDLTEDDIPPESLQSLTDRKVQALEHQAVNYLEDELRILTSTPGNFSEVARILKILKDHQGTKSKGKNAPVRSNASDTVKSWSLDDQ